MHESAVTHTHLIVVCLLAGLMLVLTALLLFGRRQRVMAARIAALQDELRQKEHQATFGKAVAGLLHDLQHPLQNLGNTARLLLRDDLSAEDRRASQATVDRELATLKRLLDDLRHIANPRPLDHTPVDLNGLVAEILESTQAAAQATGVRVSATYAQESLLVPGDPFALARALRNVVTNAVQATGAGGQVRVSTSGSAEGVELHVSDTGDGIPAEHLPAIFDEFVTSKRRGLGLGLSICRRIVEQHGGTITVHSEHGQGTTFVMRLPRAWTGAVRAAS